MTRKWSKYDKNWTETSPYIGKDAYDVKQVRFRKRAYFSTAFTSMILLCPINYTKALNREHLTGPGASILDNLILDTSNL